MTMDDVYNSIQSWLAYSKIAMEYHARKNMLKLYNELFDGYKVTKKHKHIKYYKSGGYNEEKYYTYPVRQYLC